MAGEEGARAMRALRRELLLHARRLPQHWAEWIVEAEHRWWSQVRPTFVLDHLRQPWTVPIDERAGTMPEHCDAHHWTVQQRIGRIGEVLLQYPVLTAVERQMDFGRFEPTYPAFFAAWSTTHEDLDRCWLPDELVGPWLEAFGDHPAARPTPEGARP